MTTNDKLIDRYLKHFDYKEEWLDDYNLSFLNKETINAERTGYVSCVTLIESTKEMKNGTYSSVRKTRMARCSMRNTTVRIY